MEIKQNILDRGTLKELNILLQHPFIQQLAHQASLHGTIVISGGAIVDILEGRRPKDWDIPLSHVSLGPVQKILQELNYTFAYETRWSKTYVGDNQPIQLVNKELRLYDFTISTAILTLSKTEVSLTLDKESFYSKVLKPVSFNTSIEHILSILNRIPHWRKKGYIIPEVTYHSLLSSLAILAKVESPIKSS